MTEQHNHTLEDLVSDAKLVARYGAMTGKVRGTDLLAAVADFEKVEDPSWTSEATIRLFELLGTTVEGLAPLTLVELREWKPRATGRGFLRYQPLLILLSFGLMLATFYYTSQYSRGTLILEQVSQLKTENAAWEFSKTILDIDKLASGDPKTAPLDQERYFQQVQYLKELNGRATSYTTSAREYADSDIWHVLQNVGSQIDYLFKPQPAYAAELSPAVGQTADLGATVAPAVTDAPEAPNVPSAPDNPADTAGEAAKTPTGVQDPRSVDPMLPQVSNCAVSTPRGVVEQAKDNPNAVAATHFLTNYLVILCSNGIGPVADLTELEKVVSNLKLRTGNLALWLLPALYGALGASVFYMRRVLDPTLPDPPLPKLIYRIALGAFAGIIFGWFWQPTSEFNAGFGNIGINVFGWAFLIGFSVEIFFALLERLVAVLTSWARNIGTTSSGSPGSAT